MEERKRITVGLPQKKDNMLLEDFCHSTTLSQLTSHQPQHKKEYQLRMETIIKERITDIEDNPEDYFNFGFNLQDFKQFLIKIVFSRATRQFIDKNRLRAARRMMD